MNDVAKPEAQASYATKARSSDLIVDLIKHYGFPYIALNPGASYRGLHDSLVNYGGNQPPILLCQHEKVAVQIAQRYAKATPRRAASRWWRSCTTWSACCTPPWAFITRISTAARSS